MNQQSMQACVFDAPGNPHEVLQARTVPIPTPAQGELLVRMEASPIHPADLMFIGGRYRVRPTLPQIAGLEGCGAVVRNASDLDFALGTRVAFRHPGCWAEYNVVPAGKVFRIPDGVQAQAACQFSLNPITAWALLHESHAKPGGWIAINAGSSTVSGLLRVLARSEGLNPVSIYRGKAPQGSDVAVSSDAPDLAAALLQATGGRPLAALLDSIGGPAVTRVFPALATGAIIVSYGVLDREAALISNADLIYRNLSWKGFGVDHWLAHNERLVPGMAQTLWRAISQDALPLPVRSSHGLGDCREALTAAAQGPGKVLFAPALNP
jgi:NADPH:quinone reductase-like Zn-dependent oxidoreductase